MGKQPGRKKPKRKPSEPVEDLDLRELAAVLYEHQLETNATGWFKMPWRNGWNAVEMARWLSLISLAGEIPAFLERVSRNRDSSAPSYWRASELILTMDHNRKAANYTYAALRCYQVLASNSHGGGEVYNAILQRAFEKHSQIDTGIADQALGDVVMRYRMRDAILIDSDRTGDSLDRYRRAFETAWRRGLYHAAYSIRPIQPRNT